MKRHASGVLFAIGFAISVALTASACAPKDTDSSKPSHESSATSATTSAQQSTPATTAPSTTERKSQPHGLLVGEFNQKDNARFSVFDLKTGSFTTFKTFQSTQATIGVSTTNQRVIASPDWKRIGANMKVGNDQHAGWVDEGGKFTDVTAAVMGTSPRDDFAEQVLHGAIGFDRAGDFFLWNTRSDSYGTEKNQILRVSPANPSVAVPVGTGQWEHTFYFNRNRDFVAMPDGCSSTRNANDFVWLDDNRYMTRSSGAANIIIWDARTTFCPLETAGAEYETKVFPEDLQYGVWLPLANPAGDTIAFISKTPNFSGFYTIPATGGTPTRTGLTVDMTSQQNLRDQDFLGWI